MYKELVKRLRYDAELLSQDGWAAGLFTEAADAIEELQHSLDIMGDANAKLRNQVPDWIPVTERLPKMRDAGILKKLGINLRSAKCLIVISDGKDQIVDNDAELRDGKWHSNTLRWLSVGKKTFEVTHWMPLPKAPELPKEESNHDAG